MPIEVNVTVGDEKRTHLYNTGGTLADAVDLFGQEVVKSKFDQKVRIEVADKLRSYTEKFLEDGDDFETAWDKAVVKVGPWKPGQAPIRQSKEEKALNALAGFSDEDLERIAAKKGIDVEELKAMRDLLA